MRRSLLLAVVLILALTPVARAQEAPQVRLPETNVADQFLAYRDYVYGWIPVSALERQPIMLGLRVVYVLYAMASYARGYETYWDFRGHLDAADIPEPSPQTILERQFAAVVELLRGDRLDFRTANDILGAILKDWQGHYLGADNP